MFKLKRVYDKQQKGDGFRVLVERLWPRGLTKEKAGVDLWLKDVAPSPQLRKWYGHDIAKWPEFKKKYSEELKKKKDLVVQLKKLHEEHGIVSLVYAAKDNERNSAVVLKIILDKKS